MSPVRIAVSVCTFRRNELLASFIERIVEIGRRSDRYQLALVVVDDNPGGDAKPVVDRHVDDFPLGVHYRRAGFGNISVCRNLLLDTAVEVADLLVMTDDDCLPELDWIDRLLDVRDATGADAVSGQLTHVFPPDAPRWLTEQSIFDFAAVHEADGAPLATAQTNNCLIDVAWLRAHPEHRFDPEYGVTGGEDMVFFRGAVDQGLRVVHSAHARVTQIEPIEELSLPKVTRLSYWLGNSEALTNLVRGEATRLRLLLRAARRLVRAIARPVQRMARRRAPHLRHTVVHAAGAIGMVTGAAGVRARHH